MEVNIVAVVIATVLEFICGAVWYSAFFGDLWGKIHGFDKLSKETQKAMMKDMGVLYGVQFGITLVSTYVLAVLLGATVGWSPYVVAGLLWLGFIVPTQVSGVIFGGTESKWVTTRIAIQAGSSLVCIMVAAAVLSFF